jgi:hypothetical protein
MFPRIVLSPPSGQVYAEQITGKKEEKKQKGIKFDATTNGRYKQTRKERKRRRNDKIKKKERI